MIDFLTSPPETPDLPYQHTVGASRPVALDPTHAKAVDDIVSGRAPWAQVHAPGDPITPLFHVWRVSATSYAWRTAVMGAPAFGTIEETR